MKNQQHSSQEPSSIIATLVAYSLANIAHTSVGRDTRLHLTETPDAQAPTGIACAFVLKSG